VSEPEPISWRSIVSGTTVVSTDGTPLGKVREVLGSDADDIFHGLRVALVSGHRDVMVSAGEIEGLSAAVVSTYLTLAEVDALPTYNEQATYHLASVGWLRKHLGWKDDSKSDEEPG
jgi:hypothetical protein